MGILNGRPLRYSINSTVLQLYRCSNIFRLQYRQHSRPRSMTEHDSTDSWSGNQVACHHYAGGMIVFGMPTEVSVINIILSILKWTHKLDWNLLCRSILYFLAPIRWWWHMLTKWLLCWSTDPLLQKLTFFQPGDITNARMYKTWWSGINLTEASCKGNSRRTLCWVRYTTLADYCYQWKEGSFSNSN